MTTRLRRRLLATVGTLAVSVVGLAACTTPEALAETASTSPATSDEAAPATTQTITDETGRTIELQLPIEKAVLGSGGNGYIVELVRAIGAKDAIAGSGAGQVKNDGWGSYYANVAALEGDTNIITGQSGDFNYERIIEISPDVFITGSNSKWQEAESKLEPFGIKVIVLTAWETRYSEYNIDLAGELFGVQDGAQQYNEYLKEIEDLIQEKTGDISEGEKKAVYLESSADYSAAVPGGFDWVIQYANGRNIFGDIIVGEDDGSFKNYDVDPAEIIARNPEYFVKLNSAGLVVGNYEPEEQSKFLAAAESIRSRAGADQITAIQDNNLFVISNFYLSGASKWLGALRLSAWLYPERYEGVDIESYFERYVTDFQGVEFFGEDAYVYQDVR